MKMRMWAAALILTTISAYGQDPRYAAPEAMGTPPTDAVPEISGLAVSRHHPGVVWVHNDSGDEARVYGLRMETGELVMVATLPDIEALDWEDMAIGPGPDRRFEYLYLADFGNNQRKKKSFVIYRTPEPVVMNDPAFGATQGAAKFVEALRFTYPEPESTVYDAETLLVDPETGAITVITKDDSDESGPSYVFRTEGAPDRFEVNILTPAGEIQFGSGIRNRVSGGDVSADRKWVIVRSYLDARLYPLKPNQHIAESLQGMYITIPLANEPQGEAIGFDRRHEFDDAILPTFYSVSEVGPKQVNPSREVKPIMRYRPKTEKN